MAERCLDKFSEQNIAKTAWAFVTVGQQDVQFFKSLARTVVERLDKFSEQDITKTAWAFATVRQ